MCWRGLTPGETRMAVGGGRTPVGGLPTPGTIDPRLTGLLMPEGGRWLVMVPKNQWKQVKKMLHKKECCYSHEQASVKANTDLMILVY